MIDGAYAILLISPDAERLCRFYRDALGLPLVDEAHEGIPLHYGCDLGAVHFAIHPAKGWPGLATKNAQSPVIALRTSDVDAVARGLTMAAVEFVGPADHGFALAIAFRDPDGNQIEVMQPKSSA